MTDSAELFRILERINQRPEVYSRYTADALWNSPDISEMMLRFHLDGDVRPGLAANRVHRGSLAWIGRKFGLRRGHASDRPWLRTRPVRSSSWLEAGARVTGVDFCERSIEHARSRRRATASTIDYRLATTLRWEHRDRLRPGHHDHVRLLRASPGAARPALRQVYELLAPGRRLPLRRLLAGLLRRRGRRRSPTARPDGRFLVVAAVLRLPQHLPLRAGQGHAREVPRSSSASGMREYLNWFQHYDLASLDAEVEASGLVFEQAVGDVAGEEFEETAPEFAVIARRPKWPARPRIRSLTTLAIPAGAR